MEKNAKGGRLLIITGMSGAGKSQVVNSLEDMGFFCVDNLPPILFSKFIAGMRLANDELPNVAIVADVRAGVEMMPQIETALVNLRQEGIDFQIVYMEAADNVLLARYKENRRRHPLNEDGTKTTLQCIREERMLMEGLRGSADIIIDTTNCTNQKLAKYLENLFVDSQTAGFTVSVTSFGYKYGIPIDADLVMDVRFLPNPYYIQELKNYSGLEQPVADYVLKNDITREFIRLYMQLLQYLLPHYQEEGKKHISIAIGCTGGRHRSVALAEQIGKKIRSSGYKVTVDHRDIERKKGQ